MGFRFCDSSDDEEYEVVTKAAADPSASEVSAVVVRTGKPHEEKAKQAWDLHYLARKQQERQQTQTTSKRRKKKVG